MPGLAMIRPASSDFWKVPLESKRCSLYWGRGENQNTASNSQTWEKCKNWNTVIHAGEQNNTLGARDLHTRKTPLVPRVGNKESSTVHAFAYVICFPKFKFKVIYRYPHYCIFNYPNHLSSLLWKFEKCQWGVRLICNWLNKKRDQHQGCRQTTRVELKTFAKANYNKIWRGRRKTRYKKTQIQICWTD